jgi:hypothetical protein
MKARLVAYFVRNDISYEVQIYKDNKWICIRCFDAKEKELALNYLNDIGLININKYDSLSQFPNIIISEVG